MKKQLLILLFLPMIVVDQISDNPEYKDLNSINIDMSKTFNTLENDTLTVDLHFGNELVTLLTFECDGDKVNFITPGYSLYILGSNCY